MEQIASASTMFTLQSSTESVTGSEANGYYHDRGCRLAVSVSDSAPLKTATGAPEEIVSMILRPL